MSMVQIVRRAEAVIRERYRLSPELDQSNFYEQVEDLVAQWLSDPGHEPEDSPRLEPGRDNCDDWGTGEGAHHGRM